MILRIFLPLYFQLNLQYKLSGISSSCFRKNRPCPTRLPFINHVNHITLSIISALRTTLRCWNRSMMSGSPSNTGSSGHIWGMFKHLGLWDQKARPPPKANSPPMAPQYHIDYTDSQLPVSDNYLYVDPQYPETYTAWFLKEQTGTRDSSTQISSIFRPSGKIKHPIHCLGIRPFPIPIGGTLIFSQPAASTTSWGWFCLYSLPKKRLLIT